MSGPKANHEILLEAGTNELEVLVFRLGKGNYGVNVAKVREIIGKVRLVGIPKLHPAVVGVFKLRDSVIPLLDLHRYFNLDSEAPTNNGPVILMEFNDLRAGFLVNGVDRIFRMSWKDVRPMPLSNTKDHAPITSVCEIEGKLVLMVDFEKIAFDINGCRGLYDVGPTTIENAKVNRARQHVVLAEDSTTIREAIESSLIEAGYNVSAFSDGSFAWDALSAGGDSSGKPPVSIVVTDIEMPRMDGLHLCKRVKGDPRFRELPVIVFSSLVSDTNLKKCTAVGADAAITKPQMARLVGLLDQMLAARQSKTPAPRSEELVVVS
jgi:two-component system, chemotaxis family, chemotaxis protein CheV